MSLELFQATMVRLIADPDFRDRVRSREKHSLPNALSSREADRLLVIANSRGLDVNRTLHKGFRLGKLRALLPLTCQALGSRRLGREASAFWLAHPPTSFYFLPEAIQFCDFLASRPHLGRYVADARAYERATLELQRARIGAAPPQTIRFHYDPGRLLATLAAGQRPRGIDRKDCTAVGDLDVEGRVRWQIVTTTSPLVSSTVP